MLLCYCQELGLDFEPLALATGSEEQRKTPNRPDASTTNYKFVPTKASSFQFFSICLNSRHVLGRSLGVLFVGRPV